jgi:phosphoribosylanthranilate isomerase
VFYPPSPRFLSPERARELRNEVPAFVSTVALFVNAPADDVSRVIERVRPDLLQFHGEESPQYCRSFGRPYLKACRVKPGVDLLEYLQEFPDAAAWMADAYVEAYGGTGTTFDWSLVPAKRERPLVLSGGLSRDNVRDAVRRVRPWAVDVSSGVESAKGVKDAARITDFIAEVRNADV